MIAFLTAFVTTKVFSPSGDDNPSGHNTSPGLISCSNLDPFVPVILGGDPFKSTVIDAPLIACLSLSKKLARKLTA